jgi:hypothetical protein
MKEKYGYENHIQAEDTEKKEARISKMKETLKKKYGWDGSVVTTQYCNERGYSDKMEYYKAITCYVETNNISPYSSLVLEEFRCSTFVISDAIKVLGREDLLYKNFRDSTEEVQIYEFLTKSLNISESQVLKNKRPLFMQGLELDLYLPDYQVAIEYHGLAHHSERPVFGHKNIQKIKTVHEEKYLLCKKAGIKLIQIFEDEWENKKTIVKSMIKNRLSIPDTRIFARKCGVMHNIDSIEFFNKTHISGHTNASLAVGLEYDGQIVAAMSFRKSWTSKYGNVIEIARFSSRLGYSVVGGFSKLLAWAENYYKGKGYQGILTYADCRFGTGEVYLINGFKHLGKTKPNYYYEKQGVRENRFKHRKNKDLPGNTEREQQNGLGWYAIYDAGNEIYRKELD